jgi:hypothetical protein
VGGEKRLFDKQVKTGNGTDGKRATPLLGGPGVVPLALVFTLPTCSLLLPFTIMAPSFMRDRPMRTPPMLRPRARPRRLSVGHLVAAKVCSLSTLAQPSIQ